MLSLASVTDREILADLTMTLQTSSNWIARRPLLEFVAEGDGGTALEANSLLHV